MLSVMSKSFGKVENKRDFFNFIVVNGEENIDGAIGIYLKNSVSEDVPHLKSAISFPICGVVAVGRNEVFFLDEDDVCYDYDDVADAKSLANLFFKEYTKEV